MGVEARKMLVTRSVWGIVVATIVVTAVGALQTAIAAEEGKAVWERQGFFLATINMRLFLLVLGAKFVTDEFRFGTIVPALLITPRRERFVAAKLAVVGVGGLVAAALATAALTVATWPHLGDGLQGAEVRSLGGLVLAGGLWALIGGAAGFIVRNQVGAIVGAIVWVIVVDQILVGRLGDLGRYLPSDAGSALAIAPSVRVMVLGGLILAAYAAGAAVLGTILTQRRDVA
jgi:hypothetical protein